MKSYYLVNCWVTNETPIKKIASEDIKIFKLVRSNLKSLYYRFQYEIGETYIADIKFNGGVIDEGIHSYSRNCVLDVFLGYQIWIMNPCRNRNLEFRIGGNELTTLLCTIPKGAEYYENECGEFVSDTIIIEKEIKIPDYSCIIKYIDLVNESKEY